MSTGSALKRALLVRPIATAKELQERWCLLKAALLGLPWVVVIGIPFHIGASDSGD